MKATWKVTENQLTFNPDLSGCFTLDAVEERLKREYPSWFVYHGGHHVALHRREGDDQRLLLVVES